MCGVCVGGLIGHHHHRGQGHGGRGSQHRPGGDWGAWATRCCERTRRLCWTDAQVSVEPSSFVGTMVLKSAKDGSSWLRVVAVCGAAGLQGLVGGVGGVMLV